MRVLIINYEYPPVGGGAGNASRYIANQLVKKGHRVSVITSAWGSNRGMSTEDGVCVYRVLAFRRKVDRSNIFQMVCFVCSAILKSSRVIKKDGIERVIAFFTIPSGVCAYWILKRTGIPYIVSLRGGDVPGFVPEMSAMHSSITWLRRGILSSAKAIVANSNGLAKLAEDADEFPVAVIPNGVDGSFFNPGTEDSTLSPVFRVLFVGRLHPQKNLRLLLQQFARLKDSEPKRLRACELHIVGDGPSRSELQEYANDLGFGDNIIWHGWRQKPELVEHYQAAHCFVNPSLYEGMSNSMLEAMASGLAVVAGNIPGNDELLVDTESGILFDLERPNQLGDNLLKLSNNPELTQVLGDAARHRALEMFSWDKTSQAYLKKCCE